MFRKILIYGAAIFVTGCVPKQAQFDIEQKQHERGLEQIMQVYESHCGVRRGPAYVARDESFCNGVRESYWSMMADRNLQGFPEYERLREAKKEIRESTVAMEP